MIIHISPELGSDKIALLQSKGVEVLVVENMEGFAVIEEEPPVLNMMMHCPDMVDYPDPAFREKPQKQYKSKRERRLR